jgi:hypothetical protein
MRPDNELEAMGIYFGYPECCVRYFLRNKGQKNWNRYALGSWAIGTGYIPCPSCIKKPKHEIIKTIMENRICETVFPENDHDLAHEFVMVFCYA